MFAEMIGAVSSARRADRLVTCHLCGRALRSVTVHLRGPGWTKEAYCAAFGLERGQSLEGPETRKLRAAALASRLVFESAVREGSAAGRDRPGRRMRPSATRWTWQAMPAESGPPQSWLRRRAMPRPAEPRASVISTLP